MKETVNLKAAIVFRIPIGDTICAFSTKTFMGRRMDRGNKPKPSDHVPYEVSEFVVESTSPWYKPPVPVEINVLWSSVSSVQHHKDGAR